MVTTHGFLALRKVSCSYDSLHEAEKVMRERAGERSIVPVASSKIA
jgi:hypothetical protein